VIMTHTNAVVVAAIIGKMSVYKNANKAGKRRKLVR